MKTTPVPWAIAGTALLIPNLFADPITDNDYDDFDPVVSGKLIVWQAYVPSGDAPPEEPADDEEPVADDIEIMVQFDGDLRQITDNDGDDINLKVSGTNIVWQSWDGEDWEIWAYNAEADIAEQLTDNNVDDINPCIDGNDVVWQGMESAEGDYEIFSKSIASMIPIEATFRITPRALNLRSRGRWVNVMLSVPSGDPETGVIDPSTILLQGSIAPERVTGRGSIWRMTFDRAALQALLTGPGNAEITIEAETTTGMIITGTDTIKVIP